MEKILPRLIRLRDVPTYLGMDKNRFNSEVRQMLTEIPIGNHGIAFDRLDLDAWVDKYKEVCGRPGVRRNIWGEKERQVSTKEKISGTSISKSTESAFQKALAQITLKKLRNI